MVPRMRCPRLVEGMMGSEVSALLQQSSQQEKLCKPDAVKRKQILHPEPSSMAEGNVPCWEYMHGRSNLVNILTEHVKVLKMLGGRHVLCSA